MIGPKPLPVLDRRQWFGRAASGLSLAALASILQDDARGADPARSLPSTVGPHHPPRARQVIQLFMSGGASQLETWDYKPALEKMFDQDLPASVIQGQRFTTMTSGQKRFPIAPSRYRFRRAGQMGTWISELLPHTAGIVDDLCVVRSLYTEAINHDPAMTFVQTGHEQPGRPSLGSWISYGLGSENRDLPAYVVMTPSWTGRQDAQALFSRLWSTGFIPTHHQGVPLRPSGDPVLYLSDPPGMDRQNRRSMLDGLARMNRLRYQQVQDPETIARTHQYEMAFRMQASVPELMDTSGEPDHVLDLYGPDVRKPGTFAHSCLLARRLVERGVRFVQLWHRGWDQHGNLTGHLPKQCQDIDQPCAGLVRDLKQRGLLDDTLVLWNTEFGRTTYCQGDLSRENYGRDHHPRCFTGWMAGGGVKGGREIGQTDDFSYNIVDRPVHVHDWNATILHLLGLDHERLTFRFQGRDFRLTDVHGHVVHEMLA